MDTFINYEYKCTITTDNSNLIDLLYYRFDDALSNELLKKLGKTKQDILPKFPIKYIKDLYEYEHFLYVESPLLRIYRMFKSMGDIVWITAEQFPKQRKTNLLDFCEFILTANPNNLHSDIKPYNLLDNYESLTLIDDKNIHRIINKLNLNHLPLMQEQLPIIPLELFGRILNYYD